jgi:hypothetical protein
MTGIFRMHVSLLRTQFVPFIRNTANLYFVKMTNTDSSTSSPDKYRNLGTFISELARYIYVATKMQNVRQKHKLHKLTIDEVSTAIISKNVPFCIIPSYPSAKKKTVFFTVHTNGFSLSCPKLHTAKNRSLINHPHVKRCTLISILSRSGSQRTTVMDLPIEEQGCHLVSWDLRDFRNS